MPSPTNGERHFIILIQNYFSASIFLALLRKDRYIKYWTIFSTRATTKSTDATTEAVTPPMIEAIRLAISARMLITMTSLRTLEPLALTSPLFI